MGMAMLANRPRVHVLLREPLENGQQTLGCHGDRTVCRIEGTVFRGAAVVPHVRHNSCRLQAPGAGGTAMRAREMMLTLMIGGALLAAARTAGAQEEPLDPNTKRAVMATVGNDALQLGYMQHNDPVHNADLDLGLLMTQDRQFMGTAALMFWTQLGPSTVTIAAGPIGYLAWLEGQGKTQVAAIGGAIAGRWDALPGPGLAVVVHGAFSPGILTFGSANNVYDFLAGVQFRASDKFTILAGYRWLKITLNNQPADELLNEVYAGVTYRLK
jgi:hypothetical protein